MSDDIAFLRKHWELTNGYLIKKYGMPDESELSEYGKLILIDYPRLLDQLSLLSSFNAEISPRPFAGLDRLVRRFYQPYKADAALYNGSLTPRSATWRLFPLLCRY
jgi:hypothetical protein